MVSIKSFLKLPDKIIGRFYFRTHIQNQYTNSYRDQKLRPHAQVDFEVLFFDRNAKLI